MSDDDHGHNDHATPERQHDPGWMSWLKRRARSIPFLPNFKLFVNEKGNLDPELSQDLINEFKITQLQILNDTMTNAEHVWGKQKDGAEGIRAALQEQYELLGIYLDDESNKEEKTIMLNGSIYDTRESSTLKVPPKKLATFRKRGDEKHLDSVGNDDIYPLPFCPLKLGDKETSYHWFPVPFEQKIRRRVVEQTGRSYRASSFSQKDKIQRYVNGISQTMKEMCDEAIAHYGPGSPEAGLIQSTILPAYADSVASIFNEESDFCLQKYDTEVHRKVSGTLEESAKIEQLTQSFERLRLSKEKVEYWHSYKVINVYEVGDDYGAFRSTPGVNFEPRENEIIPHKHDNFTYASESEKDKALTKIAQRQEELKQRYGDHITFWESETEKDGVTTLRLAYNLPGLDEHGKPLEVDERGVVLVDKYRGLSPRTIGTDTRFNTSIDPLEQACYIDANFDSYRDDMRDGRYHPNSQSILEYLMVKEEMLEGENKKHDTWWNRFRAGFDVKKTKKNEDGSEEVVTNDLGVEEQKVYSSAIKRYNEGHHLPYEMQLRGRNKTWHLSAALGPGHLNPAIDPTQFDKEHIHISKHKGRLFYHHTQNYVSESPERTLSTRGIAMYIQARLMEEMFRWDQYKQVQKEFGKASGFDAGGNLTGERFGRKLSGDFFDPLGVNR